MSGPKVARIVTIEEMERIKKDLISALESQVKNLFDIARDTMQDFNNYREEVNKRIEQYKALPAIEYRRLQSEIPSEIDFFKSERNRLKNIKIKNIENRQKNKRRLIETYYSLKEISKTKKNLKTPVLDSLTPVSLFAGKEEIDNFETQLDEAWRELQDNPPENKSTTDNQSEIIKRIALKDKSITFSELKRKLTKPNKHTQRLDRVISELLAIDCDEKTKSILLKNADDLRKKTNNKNIAPMIDTLILKISAFVREEKEKAALREKIEGLEQQLFRLGLASDDPRLAKLKSKYLKQTKDSLTQLSNELNTLKKQLFEEHNRESTKEALLEALNQLGYTAADNLDTALTEGQKLILRKNPSSQYGIEIKVPPNLKKFQVQVVTNAASHDKEQDISEEEAWCEDFHKLKDTIEATGSSMTTEIEMKPGEKKVPYRKFENKDWQTQRRQSRQSQFRSNL